MKVKEVMTQAKAIDEDLSLKKAAEVMEKENISSLIIVNGKKVAGIITHEDLVEHYGEKKKISEVMVKKVITINEESDASKALAVLEDNHISVLPVTNKNNELVGIVGIKELVSDKSERGDFLLE